MSDQRPMAALIERMFDSSRPKLMPWPEADQETAFVAHVLDESVERGRAEVLAEVAEAIAAETHVWKFDGPNNDQVRGALSALAKIRSVLGLAGGSS